MDDLIRMSRIATSGMKAQASRLRVISENLANADSVGKTPGSDPYRRKTISFKSALDRQAGVDVVRVDKVGVDRAEFDTRYEPSHPAADENGYVKRPNVNPLIELTDMREAQRTYEANLNVINSSKEMVKRTIDMLR
ncbi:MAG: flagellar basal body rod protein FlgC [Alphaproteobacteria bacterium]|nr:flagellar basal body rod protein FlgC [Alphaproteobacteria bacterium]